MVECRPSMHKGLGSIPSTSTRKINKLKTDKLYPPQIKTKQKTHMVTNLLTVTNQSS